LPKTPVKPTKPVKPSPAGKSQSTQTNMARKGHVSRSGASSSTRRSQKGDAPLAKTQNQSGLNIPGLTDWHWKPVSDERKLDVFGIFLALLGILFLISLVTPNNPFTGVVASALYKTSGWGTYLLPLALFALGVWFILRNSSRLPMLSIERISGIVLAYFTVVTLFHLFATGAIEPQNSIDERGGGIIGGVIGRILISGFGQIATGIIMVAMALVSLVLILDLSVPDLWHKLAKGFSAVGQAFKPKQAVQPGTPAPPPLGTMLAPRPASVPRPEELPANFIPINLQTPQPDAPVKPTRPTASRPAPTPASSQQPQSELSTLPTQAPGEASVPPAPPLITWTLPSPTQILDPAALVVGQGAAEKDNGTLIEKTLASFGVPGHIVDIQHGPTVTLYGLEPDFIETRNGRTRVRVSKIVSLADDLALALAAQRIRIQAPVPGRNFVGIEVPNAEITRVSLLEILESESFKKIKSQLKFTLGKDVSGRAIGVDLTSMPHMLIAGTTGSGKSVCVNAILACLLLNNTPMDLRLVLVDPKRVELTGYNGIPHLLTPVIVEVDRVVGALQWMQREMEGRYQRFAKVSVRNIQEFNTRNPNEKLPYIVIVIDELADLMMLAPDETERSITRLAQLARATGIHLILATQRPSVDVITGLIKANFPARIAFTVASGIDSRVILDQPGAERLLGRGDMLFQSPDAPAPVRLQGVYVSDQEIQRLVDAWRIAAMNTPPTQPTAEGEAVENALPRGVPLIQVPLWDELKPAEEQDPLFKEAIELVRKEGRASITMLQRRMRIGYTRAARLVDSMEDKKIIGPALANTQVREVLDYGQTAPPAEI
jgi:DNA segregation ATPase FtsK/SpoIIIE, S-DNA-T family